MTTAWAIEFGGGVRSEQMWPDRDSACRWASRELGPGDWQAVERPAHMLSNRGHLGANGVVPLEWPHPRLTEVELVTLDILSSLKPFARAEEMARWGCGDYKALANGGRLQRMGFYSVNRAGAITPDRDRIKHALRQHDRPANIRSLDHFKSKYYGQALNPFKPSEPAEPAVDVESPFLRGYLACAEWTSDDEAPSGEYQPSYDWTPAALLIADAECEGFLALHPELRDSENAGHDFWLTRCGHGAGFWDGDWPEPQASEYTASANRAGERWAARDAHGQWCFL